MQEQTAVLAEDHGEWILAADDVDPERVWEDLDAAMGELLLPGWQVVQSPTHPAFDGGA